MIAIRVYKNYETHKLLGYSIVNEQTLDKTDISNKVIRQMYRCGNRAVSNLEITPDGRMRLKNMNPNVRTKWYRRTMSGDVMAEHYCVITAVKNGLISFIADTVDGNIISGNKVTLSDVASALKIPISDLKFYNGYISEDEIGKTELNIYNMNTGEYTKILEKTFNITKGILGKNWEARISDTNTNGAYVISLKNVKGESKATIPNVIYHLERFRGGVNHLTIESSMQSFGKKCFSGLNDLYTLVIKEGIKVIPEECFSESLIEKIDLPSSVEEIQDNAFYKCKKLRGPLVSNAIHIGRRAFYGTKITIINIEHTEYIGLEAFANNNKLKELKLYEGLKVIDHGAFRWCASLETVTIPSTVEKIGRKAFDSCEKLRTANIIVGNNSIDIAKDSFGPNVVVKYIRR